jgi:hypothetical protein
MADNPLTDAKGLPHNKALTKYWTAGEGRLKWFGHPHPYTALTRALKQAGVPRRQVNGLAAQYFFMAYGMWPGQRPRNKD